MTANRPLSRRHLIGGLGAAGAATATGVGLSGMAFAADGVNKDDERRSPAPSSTGISPRDLANPITQTLSAADFVPETNGGTVWAYAGLGGVVVTSGSSNWFDGSLRLPVGAVITGAQVLVQPNGVAQTVYLMRYRAATFESDVVASANSTAGTSPETVPLAVTHSIEGGWTYRFEVFLALGGSTLYGAE